MTEWMKKTAEFENIKAGEALDLMLRHMSAIGT